MSAPDILKDFKGSLTIEQDGSISNASGILQESFYNNKEFASTIISMLHDVNKITSSNNQEFKRMTVVIYHYDEFNFTNYSNNKNNNNNNNNKQFLFINIVSFSEQTFIVTAIGTKIYVVVQ
ncbi:hypothetical protein ACTFIW_000638 [Dictyostelium discoideum]